MIEPSNILRCEIETEKTTSCQFARLISKYIKAYPQRCPLDTSSWWGICAPRDTPREIVTKLNAEINRGLADQKIKQRFTEMGVLILGDSPADFGKMIIEETAKWGKVVKFANVTAI